MNKETFTNPFAKPNLYNKRANLKAATKIYRCFFVLFCVSLILGFELHAQVLWSNPSSWTTIGKTKPVAGSAVTIPAGVHMILDETPPNLANLTILGKLEFADKDLNLTVGWIMLHGTLQVGTASTPYTKKAIITLNAPDKNENVMDMGTRGIMVMAGKLELHGVPPTKISTKINDHAAMGAKSLSLLDAVSWKVSDQIVVSPTDYYTDVQYNAPAVKSMAQRTDVTAINGTSLNILDGLNAHRWGKLQYVTTTGMSLTQGTLPANIVAGTPTVLDERAEVANLTRNIVIQSEDDALWQNEGFGCHIMIMRMNGMVGEAHLNGIEIKRGGQAGRLGRYPFHWHMLSYEGSTTLPDVTGQYIRNSTVNQSANRGIVIHGTNGAEVSNNVVYDVLGHGIFFENASERRNIIDGNLVLKIRNPLSRNVLKKHETDIDRGSSGFWISNPDNTITNNTAADCEGIGFWLAFSKKTFGSSSQIALNPSLLKFGIFNNNHAHSNKNEGIFLDNAEIDEAGNTGGNRYTSTTDMLEPQWPYDNVLTFELADYSVWKNNRTGIWNRSASPRNTRVIAADNTSKSFSGASDNIMSGVIEKTLVVGVSLNSNMNGVTVPTTYGADEPPVAFASYHSTFDIKDNLIVNFPVSPGKTSGAFAIDDYYLIPVDKGTVRNPNNIIINSHPGVRIPPREPQFTFGVVWDPHNYWGGSASNDNYYVFNTPFFTYGQTPHIVQPSALASGGVIVNGPFYGFDSYRINEIDRTFDKISITRTNIAGTTVGNWEVAGGVQGGLLANMRHFATHPTGYYYLDFPTIDNINEFTMRVSNMLTVNDYQVMSVEYSGAYSITQLFASKAYNMKEFGNTVPFPTAQSDAHAYTEVVNFQSVVNAPNGEVYWHDKINNKVWFKVRGGLNAGDSKISATNDVNLYKEFNVRAYGLEVLPVSLFSFSGDITPTGNLLNWKTSTENNTKTFEIFRSTNGIDFQKIGVKETLAIDGNSTSLLAYSFNDISYNLDAYYQLKQVDNDGKIVNLSIIFVKATTPSNAEIVVKGRAAIEIASGTTTTSLIGGTNFGNINLGSNFTRSYNIANTGSGRLNISSITLSNPKYTLVNNLSFIGAGGNANFTVRYSPTVLGTSDCTVTIANNDADESSFTFAITGQCVSPEIVVKGRAAIEIASGTTTTSLVGGTNFNTVNLGSSFTRSYNIANTGNTNLNISSITLSNPSYTLLNTLAFIGAGGNADFRVRFSPTVSGTSDCTVTIASNDVDESSFTFALTGLGLAPEIVVKGRAAIEIASGTTTTSMVGGTNFNTVNLGSSFTRSYNIANTGNTNLNISSITLSNPSYSLLNTLAFIGAGGNADFRVKYSPTVSGTSNCTVTIASNDADENPFTFAITGTGVTSGGINFVNKGELLAVREEKTSEVEIYPNPANASFEVSIPSESATITIISLEGRVVKKVNANSKITTINSENWIAGTYLLQVQTGTQSTVKKVLIVK